MADTALSPAALAALIAEMLAGVTEQDEQYWASLVGNLQQVHLSANPKANWRITPTGKTKEIATILRAMEVVQAAHPYVVW